jgi:hypothetical protein
VVVVLVHAQVRGVVVYQVSVDRLISERQVLKKVLKKTYRFVVLGDRLNDRLIGSCSLLWMFGFEILIRITPTLLN